MRTDARRDGHTAASGLGAGFKRWREAAFRAGRGVASARLRDSMRRSARCRENRPPDRRPAAPAGVPRHGSMHDRSRARRRHRATGDPWSPRRSPPPRPRPARHVRPDAGGRRRRRTPQGFRAPTMHAAMRKRTPGRAAQAQSRPSAGGSSDGGGTDSRRRSCPHLVIGCAVRVTGGRPGRAGLTSRHHTLGFRAQPIPSVEQPQVCTEKDQKKQEKRS